MCAIERELSGALFASTMQICDALPLKHCLAVYKSRGGTRMPASRLTMDIS